MAGTTFFFSKKRSGKAQADPMAALEVPVRVDLDTRACSLQYLTILREAPGVDNLEGGEDHT